MWCKFEGCSKCAMSTVTGVIAYVMSNVFRRARETDSDMSSRSAAGRLDVVCLKWPCCILTMAIPAV